MVFYEALNSPVIHNDEDICVEIDGKPPCFVMAMLQNVCLCDEKTTPPIAYTGDFWYWKLTSYGLDLMRALVHSSVEGFSYFETFMEPDLGAIPQLVLLGQLNAAIHCQLTIPSSSQDWITIFDRSQYLREKSILININVFQNRVDHLIVRIQQGDYDPSGNSLYLRHPIKITGATYKHDQSFIRNRVAAPRGQALLMLVEESPLAG